MNKFSCKFIADSSVISGYFTWVMGGGSLIGFKDLKFGALAYASIGGLNCELLLHCRGFQGLFIKGLMSTLIVLYFVEV